MLEVAFRALLEIGWIAALAGIAATIALYFLFPMAPGAERRPFWRYLGLAFIAGFVGYAVGATIGIAIACSTPKGGNLCGLMGIFGVGPLLADISMFTHACYQIAVDSKIR
jgi:hypothetical protein